MGWSFLDFTGLSHFFGKLPEKLVTTDTTQTISGTKSFSSTILGSVSGSSASAAKDGAGNVIADTYETKADAATHLSKSDAAGTYLSKTDAASTCVQTAAVDQTVAGTKTFSKPIVGSVTGSSGSCTGNAATATKLATARTIALSGGATGTATSFDGSGDIAIPVTSLDASKLTGTASVSTTGNAATATNATYANWLRTSSHTDHLFHTEWDNAGYFWTYVTAGNGDYRAVRVARSDSAATANSADYAKSVITTDNGYHTILFDWSSQVPGFVGLTVDVTKMGGIVTTATLRAQWYAAYPDGPEAHNAMWGGRDITAAFNNGTVSANIANGTFKDIFPGDYITKQVTIPKVLADDGTTLFAGGTYTINWVIADCDYWINKGDNPAVAAHHVAIVPQVPLFNARMNPANTTEGGYKGSEMYKKIIPACATGIINAFGSDHILTFGDAISNSVDTSHVSSGMPQVMGTPGWFGEQVFVQCNLMSEKMVYGAPICSAGAMDNAMATRQMSAFRLSERPINYNRQWWWLRDVVSSALFAFVYGAGNAHAYNASHSLGVRPFALLV